MAFRYNAQKNALLLEERHISFEEVIQAIEAGGVLAVYPHPRADRYANQHIMVVNVREYAYVVPFVDEGNGDFFLKTIFPDRKMTKKFLGGANEH